MVFTLSSLVPLVAQATNYTWNGGGGTTTWELKTNWGGTATAYPNSYSDTATIPSTAADRPATLSTTILLGATSGNALVCGSLSTGSNSASVDIGSAGILGMRGNISIGARRTISIEGTLRNDSITGAAYTVSGTEVDLNGGTINTIAGGNGSWNFTAPVVSTGSSKIYGPVTFSSSTGLTANSGTVDLYGSVTVSANDKGLTLNNAGTVLNINSGATLTLNGASNNSELVVNTGATANLNGGTIYGTGTGGLSAGFGGAGTINVIADSTLQGIISNDTTNHNGLKPVNIGNVGGTVGDLGAHTLSLNTFTGGIPIAVGVGGVLNNSVGNSSVGGVTMLGGMITNTVPGSAFTVGASGYGSVSGFTILTSGGLAASGGTLVADAGTTANGGNGAYLGGHSGYGSNLGASANSTLDLKGKYYYLSNSNIGPNGGTVQLDGATLNTVDTTPGNYGTQNVMFFPGAINVTNNATLTGSFTSYANLTVNPGKTLTATGATFVNGNDGNGIGTVHVGAGATANWGNFTNYGVYQSDPSTQTFSSLNMGGTKTDGSTGSGYIQAAVGDVYKIVSDFVNNSTQNTLWKTSAAELDFVTNGSFTAHNFALAGRDFGALTTVYTDNTNFIWGSLDITGQTLTLQDGNTANGTTALYVDKISGLTLSGRTVTDITGNGFNIYYDAPDNPGLSGTYNLESGGQLIPVGAVVPEPATIVIWSLLGVIGIAIGRSWRRERAA